MPPKTYSPAQLAEIDDLRKALASTGALMLYGDFTYQDAALCLYEQGLRVVS